MNEKYDYDKYINPIFKQLKVKNGLLSHRISNKYLDKKHIEDLVITYNANSIKFEDPMYGPQETSTTELWFEQVYGNYISIQALRELENRNFKFDPGDVIGSFLGEIDILILKLRFGQIENNQISCSTELTFTNRDKRFEGTFEGHAKSAIQFDTKLRIEPLVYLDYHNLITNKNILMESLNSKIYDLNNIEDYDYGWKDGAMKAYKIGLI